jgi:hypothetical protein
MFTGATPVAWHACALCPVLSPLRRDTCRGGYNSVRLSAPTFLILYLGEYDGVLQHLMNHTTLGIAARETWCDPPSTLGKSEPHRLSLPRRARQRHLGRGRAISGGLKAPRPPLLHRARWSHLDHLCLASGSGSSFGSWAVLRDGLVHPPSSWVFLLLQPMALFWACQAHSISSAHLCPLSE